MGSKMGHLDQALVKIFILASSILDLVKMAKIGRFGIFFKNLLRKFLRSFGLPAACDLKSIRDLRSRNPGLFRFRSIEALGFSI